MCAGAARLTSHSAVESRYAERGFLAVSIRLMRRRPVAADTATAHAGDLFFSRLEKLDLRHPLAKLALRRSLHRLLL